MTSYRGDYKGLGQIMCSAEMQEMVRQAGLGAMSFAVGIALRHLHFPRVITYVGKISYSLYLVHPLVLYSIPQASSRPVTYVRWVIAGVIASMATYHLVELPFQRWGRRLAKKVAVHPDDVAAGATF